MSPAARRLGRGGGFGVDCPSCGTRQPAAADGMCRKCGARLLLGPAAAEGHFTGTTETLVIAGSGSGGAPPAKRAGQRSGKPRSTARRPDGRGASRPRPATAARLGAHLGTPAAPVTTSVRRGFPASVLLGGPASIPVELGLERDDDLTGPATIPAALSEGGMPAVVCTDCGLRQLPGPERVCTRCGGRLPAPAPRTDERTRAIGARTEGAPARMLGVIAALEVDIGRREDDLLSTPVCTRGETSASGEGQRRRPTRSRLRIPEAPVFVRACRAVRRVLWAIPSPREIPHWARWEILAAVLLFGLTVVAFHVQTVQPASLAHESPELGLRLVFPETGWFWEPVPVNPGRAEAYRSGLTAAEAAALLWVRTIRLAPGHPYSVPGAASGSGTPWSSRALSPELLEMDLDNLLLGAKEAADLDLDIGVARGCTHVVVGSLPAVRCRFAAQVGGAPYDLDLYGFGTNRQLVLGLLAIRADAAPALCAEARKVISTITRKTGFARKKRTPTQHPSAPRAPRPTWLSTNSDPAESAAVHSSSGAGRGGV